MVLQCFLSAKAASCQHDTSRTRDSGCWECCVLSGMFKWVLSGWNKLRGQLRGMRNALWWELVSLQEEFLSMQGAPVKYFKILSLPQFSCASPSGPVSQAAVALLRARASSLAAACSQLLHLCISTHACARAVPRAEGEQSPWGAWRRSPKGTEFGEGLLSDVLSTLALCPSLSKGDVGMDAVCPRAVPILPHVPHKAEQGAGAAPPSVLGRCALPSVQRKHLQPFPHLLSQWPHSCHPVVL